ncbi:MAG: hypothetical protein ACI9AD_001246 [Nitriliruptoraceae bacterium]|jgi:hypothetical protein
MPTSTMAPASVAATSSKIIGMLGRRPRTD